MSIAVNLSPQGVSIIDTLWTMLKPLDSNIRLALGKKLIESAKEQKTASIVLSDKIRNYKVSPFVSSLPIESKKAIPEDENGLDALLEIKYGV